LSIEVLQHVHQGNMDVACIITSDIDLTPMFDALTQTRVSSELLYQRQCAASDLIDSADVSRAIRLKDVGGWIASDFGRKLLVTAQGGGRHEATYTEERTLFGWRFEFGITDQDEHVAFNALRNIYYKGGSAEAIVEEIENNPNFNASLRW
jgi:hypothetical protein